MTKESPFRSSCLFWPSKEAHAKKKIVEGDNLLKKEKPEHLESKGMLIRTVTESGKIIGLNDNEWGQIGVKT